MVELFVVSPEAMPLSSSLLAEPVGFCLEDAGLTGNHVGSSTSLLQHPTPSELTLCLPHCGGVTAQLCDDDFVAVGEPWLLLRVGYVDGGLHNTVPGLGCLVCNSYLIMDGGCSDVSPAVLMHLP